MLVRMRQNVNVLYNIRCAAVVAECGNVDFFHAVVCEQETEQISE